MTEYTTFGIDLGTTHSCIAYVDRSGRPVVVKNEIGADTTPSVVYFEGPGKVLVGGAAKNSALLAPHLVASLVKRDMGSRVPSNRVYHKTKYTPEEISALILRELVRSAEKNDELRVRDVVITVPAHFGIAERNATRRAGQIAGLNVLDVLDEPTAAALHYNTTESSTGKRHVLVCDLGGGTYDTTVIRLQDKNFQVIGIAGDDKLGGADWDERVRDRLLREFTAQHPRLDPTGDEVFMQDLLTTAENVKKTLSSTQSHRVVLRFGGVVAQIEFTRAMLEELTTDLLDRVVDVTQRALDTARRKGVHSFDEVLLVGGMTKAPSVAAILKQRLGLDARLHEPDLAVAKGAALFAMITKAQSGAATAQQTADDLGISVDQAEEFIATSVDRVVPRGFGVKGLDPSDPLAQTRPLSARQIVVHLLQPNTPLPADTGPYPFATAVNNQRMVEIEVYEQAGLVPSEEVAANTKIGRGRLTGLPAGPAGMQIDVSFLMSETGQLSVHATEPSSGAELRFDLQIGDMDQAAVASAQAGIAKHDVSG
uniref:Chaperone protein DnaK n=1 Tax=uncultured bacterium esnapd2 TaxID=1366601 RepID=S5UBM0_9BACT|nr:chaperone protein DnaK [uncultured bacterium esnapd2]